MEAIAAFFDISPARLLPTACHGPRNQPAKRIAIPFEANILALRELDRLLVIVSIDWFFTSPGMRKVILDRCGGYLNDVNLVIAASHAHTSPNTDRTKIGFSSVDLEYVSKVEEAIASHVESILHSDEWKHAGLRFTTVHCDCSIHRRRVIWWPKGFGFQRKTAIYPNPGGPRDQDLRLLRVEADDQSLMAVLWGVSCHPTEWPNTGELSSDYPGAVRQAIREHQQSRVPVLFLQGYCGDLRPPAIGSWALRKSWRIRFLMALCSLINGPFFAGFLPKQYWRWVSGIARSACLAVDKAATQPLIAAGLAVKRVTVPLSAIGLSGEADEIAVHSFDLGEGLRVMCVSAEIVWQYAEIVQQTDTTKQVWPVGYIDQVFGYLPTQAMIAEGGYEVTEFKPQFGVKGQFTTNTEEIIRSCFFQEPESELTGTQITGSSGRESQSLPAQD
jgi:neutral ceramidase